MAPDQDPTNNEPRLELVQFSDEGALVIRSLVSRRLWGVALNHVGSEEEIAVTELVDEPSEQQITEE